MPLDSETRYELATRLKTHADHYERLGNQHPAWRYPAMVADMRLAANELVVTLSATEREQP